MQIGVYIAIQIIKALDMTQLMFTTIDLAKHKDMCIKFRRDSYVRSFPDGLERFNTENGVDGNGYIEWLRERINDFPQGCVHAWITQHIVGQIESCVRDNGTGYVNLFYLVPDARGRGWGTQLHDYISHIFASENVKNIRLSVAIQNEQAISFYRKIGWRELGLRPGCDDTLVFEYTIDLRTGQ